MMHTARSPGTGTGKPVSFSNTPTECVSSGQSSDLLTVGSQDPRASTYVALREAETFCPRSPGPHPTNETHLRPGTRSLPRSVPAEGTRCFNRPYSGQLGRGSRVLPLIFCLKVHRHSGAVPFHLWTMPCRESRASPFIDICRYRFTDMHRQVTNT